MKDGPTMLTLTVQMLLLNSTVLKWDSIPPSPGQIFNWQNIRNRYIIQHSFCEGVPKLCISESGDGENINASRKHAD